jgi:hypothetical protein
VIVLVIALVIVLTADLSKYLYVVFFLLSDSPASKFYVPTFRNTLFRLHRLTPPLKME